MANDKYGMGIPLPADSTPIHQFPAVARAMGEKMAQILSGTLPAGVVASLEAAAEKVMAGKSLVLSADARLGKLPDQSWRDAWNANSVAVLREWYRANTGPRVPIDYDNPITGIVTVTTQAEADALKGKLIMGGVHVKKSLIELSDFVVRATDDTRYLVSYAADAGQSATRLNFHHLELDGLHLPYPTVGVHGPSYSPTEGNGTRVTYCNIHGTSDGMFAGGGAWYEYNWLHDFYDHDTEKLGPWVEAIHPHSDGIQTVSGKQIRILHNFVENIVPGTNNISTLMFNTSSGAIENLLVKENYLAGGGYTVRLLDQGKGEPDVTFTDNRFGGGYILGLFQADGNTLRLNKFTRNTWAETGEPLPLVAGRLDTLRPVPNEADPFSFGYAATFLGPIQGPQNFPEANGARFLRVLSPAAVGKIAVDVAASAGNICVGVYRAEGGGMYSRPGKLLATSGAIPCPAKGMARIPLNKVVRVLPGDFLAIACDTTAAAFQGFTGVASQMGGYQYAGAGAAMPLKSNPAPANTAANIPVLAGHL